MLLKRRQVKKAILVKRKEKLYKSAKSCQFIPSAETPDFGISFESDIEKDSSKKLPNDDDDVLYFKQDSQKRLLVPTSGTTAFIQKKYHETSKTGFLGFPSEHDSYTTSCIHVCPS